MTHREMLERMTEAAAAAARAAMAAGHGPRSEEVERSSWQAAHEVYMQECPEDFQAPPVDLPSVPYADPMKARIDREMDDANPD